MKKLITQTNQYLKNPAKRREDILRSVMASSHIEGITLSPIVEKRIAESVAKRLKKSTV